MSPPHMLESRHAHQSVAGTSHHQRQIRPSGALSMMALEGVSLSPNMDFPSLGHEQWDWKDITQRGQDVSLAASTNV
jgi:hypothetical protein